MGCVVSEYNWSISARGEEPPSTTPATHACLEHPRAWSNFRWSMGIVTWSILARGEQLARPMVST